MTWFWLGVAAGVLLTVPFVAVVARRTERRVRRLEKRARGAERLAELGTLTGGLAHEIKNPLSTIGLNLQLVQEDLRDVVQLAPPNALPADRVNRLQRRFDSLTRETQRLRDILEDFLRYAGRIKLDRRPVDLHALIDELVDFFEPQAREAGVKIRSRPLPAGSGAASQGSGGFGSGGFGGGNSGGLVISADPSLLKQGLLNLLINATQAMKNARDKGTSPHGGANELIVHAHRQGDEAVVHVIDTGPGIDAQTVTKIFQPYFSSKPTGTGLGLPTTRRIIEEHGGSVQVHTDLGLGSDFTIHLPMTAPQQGDSGTQAPPA
jgi:signal transduction histidine kinase